jgi:hypothetical protein
MYLIQTAICYNLAISIPTTMNQSEAIWTTSLKLNYGYGEVILGMAF